VQDANEPVEPGVSGQRLAFHGSVLARTPERCERGLGAWALRQPLEDARIPRSPPFARASLTRIGRLRFSPALGSSPLAYPPSLHRPRHTVNMFSMSALASINLDHSELARLGVLQGTEALLPTRAVLALGWPELERGLPDHGLPRGVVEIAALPWLSRSSSSLRPSHGASSRAAVWKNSGATSIAIAAIRSVHAADEHGWCAWITPSRPRTGASFEVPSLYAPALVQANVDLDRLLIVRPSPQALARTVVKVASSGAFGLVVVDAPHRHDLCGGGGGPAARNDGGAIVVRKLALAAEECGTTTLLLTSALVSRSVPWPVALRLEVERRPDALAIRVTKDRRGCAASQHVVRLAG
jgi:hypothetical protein